MTRWLRAVGRVLGWFLAGDVAGVLLTLLCDFIGVTHRTWRTSAALGYVIWFVVGVFCGLFVYVGSSDEFESEKGRRIGRSNLLITAAIAVALALFSSIFWSSGEGVEPLVPEHRGVTLTYLTTVVVTALGAHVFLFGPRSVTTRSSFVAMTNTGRPSTSSEPSPAPAETKEFRPAGAWGTMGFLFGVSFLLVLDVLIFLLGPFDVFDRWTGPLLTGALAGGACWGLAASRWPQPRHWLLVAHAPLLVGTIFYFFGLLPAALVASSDALVWLADAIPRVAFALGFLVGCVAVGGAFAELLERKKGG